MSYQVLARKWRPKNFAELMGQEHVVRALTGGLSQGRLHHAFLFTGTRGVGKTTIARIIAKALNCELGVTATPCGTCSSCRDIDAGRFPDLIEIDAASRTKVDDTREILDNVIYAPSRGRFKVYLIDEVHMLSTHSFNALLKTLEEPPEHVKFLLATTDPQKLPVTVLSRCLKFHLKRLTITQIAQQMRHILAAEVIAFEDEAIEELARGADGSMRDGLSLLDQALAFGGGNVETVATREMLGTISREAVLDLLEALSAGSAERLSEKLSDLADFGGSYVQVMARLMEHLHQLAFLQLVGPHAKQLVDVPPRLTALVPRFSAEDLQIKFQFANLGAKEIASAPDAKIAFEMCLLRMLAFADVETGVEEPPAPGKTSGDGTVRVVATSAPISQPNVALATERAEMNDSPTLSLAEATRQTSLAEATRQTSVAEATRQTSLGERWRNLVAALPLPPGALREFAHNAIARSWKEGVLNLTVDAAHSGLANAANVQSLSLAIERHLSGVSASGDMSGVSASGDMSGVSASGDLHRALVINIVIADADLSASPAHVNARAHAAKAQAFGDSITDRPLVRDLIDVFDANIVPGSVYFSAAGSVAAPAVT
jgi:DNA polymerase III subunit gamma/tau